VFQIAKGHYIQVKGKEIEIKTNTNYPENNFLFTIPLENAYILLQALNDIVKSNHHKIQKMRKYSLQ
jgi:hypothetical protein